MQISTSSILTSQQQGALKRSAQPAVDEFAPLVFKKTAAPAAQSQNSGPPASQSVASASQIQTIVPASSQPTGYIRPGSQIDIKV